MNKEYLLLQGIFLIILTIVASTTEMTFSKQILHLLKRNYYARHILIIFLIYFTVDYTGKTYVHPLHTLKTSLLIWVMYIIATKQSVYTGLPIFILLGILYVMHSHYEYLKKMNDKKAIEESDKIMYNIKVLIAIISSGGFLYYISKQYNEKRTFSIATFIFK